MIFQSGCVPFYINTNERREFQALHSLPTLGVVILLNFGYFLGCGHHCFLMHVFLSLTSILLMVKVFSYRLSP